MSIQVQNISNTKLFSLTKISYLYLFYIDSDEKKELERLRQSQRKHNLELKQLQADVDKLLFENRNK